MFSDSLKNIKGYGPEGKVWIIINADRWCVTTDLEKYALFIKLDYLKHLNRMLRISIIKTQKILLIE